MVSKASEDLPEPETPETTVSFPWGMAQSMFFRLWVRAPRMMISSLKAWFPMVVRGVQGKVSQSDYRGAERRA